MKFALVFLLLTPTILSVSISKSPFTIKQVSIVGKPDYDLCPFCVNFMGQFLDQLLNIILNAGVLGTCGGICSQLPNQLEQVSCDLLCDYVGVESFIDLVNYEDPDPIYICQDWYACNHTSGGVVQILKTFVSPPKGPQGTTFILGLDYKVVKQTSVGTLNVAVFPPDAFPITGGEFSEGQAPGSYGLRFELQAEPSEGEPFDAGEYDVEWAICAGDCSNSHPWGGVYAQSNTTFTITG